MTELTPDNPDFENGQTPGHAEQDKGCCSDSGSCCSQQADGSDAPTAGDASEPTPDAPDAAPDTPVDPMAQLQAQLDQTNSRLLRVSADYQNYVRRSGQNVLDAGQQQKMAIIKPLLTVLDHFGLALEVDIDQTDSKSLLQGMQIVHDEFLRSLEGFGVSKLVVKPGDEFDPNCHEALMRQASEDIQSNHVVNQLQPGYMLGDKTLRPAQVSVAE